MKLIRYQNPEGAIGYASVDHDPPRKITGNLFGDFTVTDEPADVHTLLAPIEPAAILCIGRNYREHAEETGSDIPEDPVLFMKTPTALQHPGAPIQIPTALASDQVDKVSVEIDRIGELECPVKNEPSANST